MTLPVCACPAPNALCRRAGVPMVGRLWQLCAGVGCTPAESAAYRAFWDAQPATRRGVCRYLGADTGVREVCSSCRGRVVLKVCACHHPGHAARPTTTMPQCRVCADYLDDSRREEP